MSFFVRCLTVQTNIRRTHSKVTDSLHVPSEMSNSRSGWQQVGLNYSVLLMEPYLIQPNVKNDQERDLANVSLS